mmetsp:Transcript_26450/g.67595  ORF Transcript_26450/g.67595 Transcript_26450/m.67595 type:complete len:97 (-) Transcript_26450:635-925(-)
MPRKPRTLIQTQSLPSDGKVSQLHKRKEKTREEEDSEENLMCEQQQQENGVGKKGDGEEEGEEGEDKDEGEEEGEGEETKAAPSDTNIPLFHPEQK